MSDLAAIRECVENWVVWRDAGDWERFATVWHADGWMTATWFQGPASEFIKVSREGFERGVNILHALNGWSCDVAGARAISQAKMNIFQGAGGGSMEGIMTARNSCRSKRCRILSKRARFIRLRRKSSPPARPSA